MNLIDFLHSPVAQALGWTLLHAIWQGFAVVLPTAILLHILRDRSSVLRYQAGVLALLAQLLASAITFAWYYKPAVNSLNAAITNSLTQPLPIRWQVLTQTLGRQRLPWHQQTQQFLETHLSQFVLIYLIGVAVFGLRLVGGWLYLQQLSRTAVQPTVSTWAELTSRLRSVLAIQPVIQVRESARVAVPMVVGVLKPILLLPFGLAANLSTREIEAVLAHELAHVKRHDYAVNLLQSVVEVLYFFHPALWWLSARVREEREHCCDDLAVQACEGNARLLAQALARVEELRLAQAGAPALAMAFAANRQQLLHRVRRILGVQTQPVVSNASLGGLTLATLLLMSASVLAVQQRPEKLKPSIRTTQPQPTRRHKIDRQSEYGMADNQRISYVVWKGQKLPANRITKLQRQLDQVMAGQINLDNVKQPDRDILLTIIEKNVAFDAGMKALSEGMAQINYDNIEVSVQAAVPVNLTNPVVEVVDSVEVNGQWVKSPGLSQSLGSVTDTARLNAAQRELEALSRKLQAVMAERQPAIDRLSKEMTELTSKNGDWRKMSEQFERQQSVLAKQQAAFAKQQEALARKLAPLHTEMARLSLQKTAKAEQLIRQKRGQSDQLEKQMNQLSEQMGKLGSQMGELGSQMQPYQQRLSLLADSISKLVEPTSELSEKIGELSNQIAEEANEQAEKAMRMAEDAMRNLNSNTEIPSARPARPPRPASSPRPPKVSSPVTPAAPVAPPAPAAVSKPGKPAAVPKPTPVAKPVPVSVPKPAPTPKPDEK